MAGRDILTISCSSTTEPNPFSSTRTSRPFYPDQCSPRPRTHCRAVALGSDSDLRARPLRTSSRNFSERWRLLFNPRQPPAGRRYLRASADGRGQGVCHVRHLEVLYTPGKDNKVCPSLYLPPHCSARNRRCSRWASLPRPKVVRTLVTFHCLFS